MNSFGTDLLQRQNKQLREELEEAHETIRQLRAQLAPDRNELPSWLPHLTPLESRCLIALGSGRLMSKERVHEQVYCNDPSGGPAVKIVDVAICRIRRKLADIIQIETVWGQGYRLPPDAIALLWPAQREAA